jgi:hypothetical protein
LPTTNSYTPQIGIGGTQTALQGASCLFENSDSSLSRAKDFSSRRLLTDVQHVAASYQIAQDPTGLTPVGSHHDQNRCISSYRTCERVVQKTNR